jgi:threonylcarbamoyladenosine tRNA methylthiotransferase MtaB
MDAGQHPPLPLSLSASASRLAEAQTPAAGEAAGGARSVTLGCRLNALEGEVMRQRATEAGLEDAVIVNTCAVTAEAVRQGAQAIRRLRRENPGARLVVTGCAAQIAPERFAAMSEVDCVLGNGEKMLPGVFRELRDGVAPRVRVGDVFAMREAAAVAAARFGTKARAYAQVQTGCDHSCTFCVIPAGRGRSRSVPAAEIVAQVRRLVQAGYAEIVFTGVDITAYGADLPGGMGLGALVRHVLRAVPELPRLRLSSIDQVEADRELMRALAEEPRLMPHLHLSLQAGSDIILKRMRRRHLSKDAIRFCDEARRLRPDIAFGADLIAGFPTETEEMFTASLRLVDECGLSFLHVFPYSSRPGTPAARMPQLPAASVAERARRLRQKGAAALATHLGAQVGREVALLMEKERIGRTPCYAEMQLDCAQSAGQLVMASVAASDGKRLHGRLVAPMCAP